MVRKPKKSTKGSAAKKSAKKSTEESVRNSSAVPKATPPMPATAAPSRPPPPLQKANQGARPKKKTQLQPATGTLKEQIKKQRKKIINQRSDNEGGFR